MVGRRETILVITRRCNVRTRKVRTVRDARALTWAERRNRSLLHVEREAALHIDCGRQHPSTEDPIDGAVVGPPRLALAKRQLDDWRDDYAVRHVEDAVAVLRRRIIAGGGELLAGLARLHARDVVVVVHRDGGADRRVEVRLTDL